MAKVWSSVRTHTYQMTNFEVGNHVEFDDITGNLPVSVGTAQERGTITVPGRSPNLMLEGKITISIPPGQADNAYVTFQWFEKITGTYVGNAATHTFSVSAEPTSAITYTNAPVGDRQYELRVIGKSGSIKSIYGLATATESEVYSAGFTGGGGGSSGQIVYAEYTRADPQVVLAGTTDIVDYNTNVYDDLSVVTRVPEWTFTAIEAGVHLVRASVSIQAWDQSEDDTVELQLFKNGSLYCVLDEHTVFLPKTWYEKLYDSYPIMLSVGDTLCVKLRNATTKDLTILGDSVNSRIAVTLV